MSGGIGVVHCVQLSLASPRASKHGYHVVAHKRVKFENKVGSLINTLQQSLLCPWCPWFRQLHEHRSPSEQSQAQLPEVVAVAAPQGLTRPRRWETELLWALMPKCYDREG